MLTILFGVGFFALFFILMSIRLIFLKKGEFKGTCASQNPYLNKSGKPCRLCGKTIELGDSCANPENEGNEVMDEIELFNNNSLNQSKK